MSSTATEMSLSRTSIALRQVAVLVVSGIVLWGLLVSPAWLLAGVDGLVGLTISALLCVVPGCVVVVWKVFLSPTQNVLFLVSTGLRFGLIFASALLAKAVRPGFGIREFYVWLIVFYLYALAVETWLVLRRAGS